MHSKEGVYHTIKVSKISETKESIKISNNYKCNMPRIMKILSSLIKV